MSLADLIRKSEILKAATAIPAIPAIQPRQEAATVARIATIAVANPTDAKTADAQFSSGINTTTADAGKADAVTSWGWLLHFADREPLEVYCNPDASHAAILERYPEALAAEPIPERIPKVFTEAEDTAWAALWLDPHDDRRRCTQCRRLNPLGRCIAAERGEIVAAKTHTPIKTMLRRCEGYMPRTDDPDTRPGRERWPELIEQRTDDGDH